MDGGRPRVVTSIHPVANRAVVFATSTQSWHGHTVKWAGPEPRTSIALYYYAAVTGDGILPTTDYRPTTGQYYKRARKAVGRCLRAVGLR